MSKATQRIAYLNHKIEIINRHTKRYGCDLISLKSAITETEKLIASNNEFKKELNEELKALRDQEFHRYLHTPCYKYRING